MSSQKGLAPVFLLLGVAVLIFAGVGGAYLYNQTQQKQSGAQNSTTETEEQDTGNMTESPVEIPMQITEYKSSAKVGGLGFKLVVPGG